MVSEKLKSILDNRTIWQTGIHPQIITLNQSLYNGTYPYYTSQSRTLTEVLRNTLGGYNHGNANTYRILTTMCGLLDQNKKINVIPRYRLISSEEASSLKYSLFEVLDMPHADGDKYNIYLYHIPKGKSYLRNTLDEMEGLTRLRTIETFCIENTQHFIRIYRNFGNTGDNSVTVFSDQFTPYLINTLFVMFPHLFNIVPREANEDYELTEEDIEYNTKVDKLHKFFEILYEIMSTTQNDWTTYNSTDILAIQTRLKEASTEYANLFDFNTTNLNSFTKNLANARNRNAQRHYTEKLSNVVSNIQNLETSLLTKYTEKANYERALAAHKLIAEEDVMPFIETIKNSKAIEVIASTEKEMILQITAPVQYFQESDFKAYEDNPNSTYNQAYATKPYLKRILHKIFVTREYQLLFQANIHVQIQEGYNSSPLYVYAERAGNSIASPLTQFPNPHLWHHDCWQQAKTEMQKNVNEGNFELVALQMVAAVQTINVAEHASFINGFLTDFNNTSLQKLATILVPTKEGVAYMSITQAIECERLLEKESALETAQKIIEQQPKKEYTQIEIPDDDANWETNEEEEENDNEED